MATNMIEIGRWKIPSALFKSYVKLIDATERSSERYSYEFDKERENVHEKIVESVGLMCHTREYREFSKALRDECEYMLPKRFPPQKITKLTPPVRGVFTDDNE